MTDRELLEAAAKAAGMEGLMFWPEALDAGEPYAYASCAKGVYWRPLGDDGDALRLAVKLRLNITFTTELGRGFKNEFMQVSPRSLGHLAEFGPLGSDPSATLRRAIVRAAAAMAG